LCINTPLSPNITHTTTLATGIGTPIGLPTGVTASWSSNTITINGTPTVSGTFNYSIPLTGGCGNVSATGTITVQPDNTVGVASTSPTICINTLLSPNVTHTTTGATGIGTPTGLPTGVSATWASNTITISGTPTVAGIFNYSIPLTGGCGSVNATGTITVTPANTVTPGITTTLCINTALSPDITHTTTGATGIGTPTGLPTGVTATWASNTITISGTPTVSGTFNYSIPLTGGCGAVSATGTITISINSPGVASYAPTLCINTPLSPNITHTTALATGIGTPIGLPTGVTASWSSNTITINGTPTVSGTFNYSIPLTGGCGNVSATGTFTVTPEPLVTNQTQTICSDTPATISFNTSSTVPAVTYNITNINSNGLIPFAGNPAIGNGLAANVIADDAWTNIGPVPVDVVYTVVPVSAAGCEGDSFTLTLTVNPEPVVNNQAATICSDIVHNVILGNDIDTPAATTYNITNIASNGLTAFAGNPVIGTGFSANEIADDAWTNTTPAAVDVVYTVVPVSAAGCQGNPFTVTITVESTLGVGPQTVTVCSNQVIGFVLGTTPNTTYTITNINIATGLTTSGGNPATGNGLAANVIADDMWSNSTSNPLTVTYTVEPVSANGCSGQPFTVTVTINPDPIVTNQTQTICSDTPATISFNTSSTVSAVTYNITNINSNGLIPFAGNPAIGNGLAANVIADDAWTNIGPVPVDVVYTVVPVSAAGCEGDSFTLTLTVNPEPVVNNQAATICSDIVHNVILGNDIDTPAATTYNITNIASNGLTAFAGNPVIGTGFSANEIADDAWTNTTPAAVDVVYTVVPVSAAGCQGDSFTVTITVESEFPVNTIAEVKCSKEPSGIIINPNPNTTYNIISIVNNGLTPYAGNPVPGTGLAANVIADDAWQNLTSANVDVIYQVISVSSAGCLSDPFTITITVQPEPIVSDVTYFKCDQEVLNITLGNDTDGPNVSTFNILQIDAIGLVASSGNPQIGTGFDFNVLSDDSWTNTTLNQIPVTYTIEPVSAQGCKGEAFDVVVTINPQINISVTTTPITCYGDNDASITLSVTGGTGTYTALWDNLATGFYQNNLAAGVYQITITDSVGCKKIISVNIPEAPIFTINPIVSNITCFGANNGSIQLNLVGGIAPVNLVWSDGSTAGTTRNNLPPGVYTVTITDSKPCQIVRTFIITEPQPLVLNAQLTNALDCTNPNTGSINLIVSGGTPPFTYSWTNGSTQEDLNQIPNGNYAVIVTDANGCVKQAQYTIYRPDPILISVDEQVTSDCDQRTVFQQFVASASGGVPPFVYQWSSGTISGVNGQIMTTAIDGIVTLTVTDSIGCTATYSVNVDLVQLGTIAFEPVSIGYSTYGIFSINDPITFTSTITGDYQNVVWNFGDGTFSNELNPIHTYSSPGEYIVTQTVYYPFGCVYQQVISLWVEQGYFIAIPSAFTPNKDGVNDTYRPITKRLRDVQLDVYDSWGSLIYSEKGDVLVGWDAMIKGVPAENGNYYCTVKARTFYNTTIEATQTFVLIK
jgi:gliding motility-associated-like protein